MKIEVWVLSTVLVDELAPAFPRVFFSHDEAQAAFDEAMRGEWEANAPTNDEGEPIPYPNNPEAAHQQLANLAMGEPWGRWDLTMHKIEVGPDSDHFKHVAVLARAAASYCDDIDSGFRDGTYDDPGIPEQVQGIEAALSALAIPDVPAPAAPTSIDPWEEDDRFPRSDWKLDVANGDTNLGYAEWLMHQREAAAGDDEEGRLEAQGFEQGKRLYREMKAEG